MFQELAAATGDQAVVIATMFLAMIGLGVVLWRALRRSRAEHDAHARLPLEGDPPEPEARAGNEDA